MCEKCDADRGFLPLTRDQTRHRRNPEQRRQVLLSRVEMFRPVSHERSSVVKSSACGLFLVLNALN